MRTIKTKAGNLKILADNQDRQGLADCYHNKLGYYHAEGLVAEALQGEIDFIPEYYYGQLGALTSAPIVADYFAIDDNDKIVLEGDVFWFPGYMLADPYEQLKNRGYVVFTKADNA